MGVDERVMVGACGHCGSAGVTPPVPIVALPFAGMLSGVDDLVATCGGQAVAQSPARGELRVHVPQAFSMRLQAAAEPLAMTLDGTEAVEIGANRHLTDL